MRQAAEAADTRAMSNRRAAASASAVAASLRRLRAPAPPDPAGRGLAECVLCRRDFVSPVRWEPVGEERWWMFLRCAECGTSREVVVSNAVAERYDAELARGARAISRAVQRLDQERMAAEAQTFVTALQRGIIDASDFAR
jgi:hypothetical protein